MSKILLNHNFKCVQLSLLGDETPFDVIQRLCSDIYSNECQTLLTKLASSVVRNGIYKTSAVHHNNGVYTESPGLIPLNSKLYSHGANTEDPPTIGEVFELMESKVKIDDKYENLPPTGHFRFQLPSVISPQLLVLVDGEDKETMTLLYHGNSKLLDTITNYLGTLLNCAITDRNITSEALAKFLEWGIRNDTLDSVGDIELWFGKFKTNGKLGTILIRVKEKDIKVLKKAENVMKTLFEFIKSQTGISLEDMMLVKVQCYLFSASCDAKLKFNSSMSTMPKIGDHRLSVWHIIRHMYD